MMKTFRLIVHQKTFSEDDLIISQKDYVNAQVGDIVEIYHPTQQQQQQQQQYDDLNGGNVDKSLPVGIPTYNNITNVAQQQVEEFPRLLLQIRVFRDEMLQTRDTISVEQSIANTFGLQPYKNVVVRLVNAKDVALDSIELTFKDQYMGRSEMWRLKNSLTNTCVYMNKKMEFCGGAIRCQVYEMWAQGDRVACGVINHDTKVVFRSSTSMVYLFLQMSSEMWDFDIHGDLYFEKAVNGFLADLFLKWKKNGSNHEVTIVLFSRTFYEATSLEEFPLHMRECLQKDYKGRYYEDFYRVAVQNERYDDWSGILVQLRRIFSQYLTMVLEYHSKPNVIHPVAVNSTAAQGNFLEVLNMSLNVFEKHYLDRSFDRTGQLSVVVTPGVGVFEVDRELTNITKQRIIDNGVGSDLVCVGEQPLHAVPLLKFHNKDTHLNVPDDYSMPHWINLSFYSSNKKIAYSNFIPRIKLPPQLSSDSPVPLLSTTSSQHNIQYSGNRNKRDNSKTKLIESKATGKDPKADDSNTTEYCIHNTAFFDYDAYDAQVFQLPATLMHQHQRHDQIGTEEISTNYTSLRNNTLRQKYRRTVGHLLQPDELGQVLQRQLSDPYLNTRYLSNKKSSSDPINIPNINNNNDNGKDFSPSGNSYEFYNSSINNFRKVVGSEGSPPLESRALINPFDPSHVTIKLTSNRRRWTHIFPKGPTGVLIQQHHYQAIPAQSQDIHSSSSDNTNCGKSQDNNVVGENHHLYQLADKKTNGSNQLVKNYRALEALREYCNKRPNNYQNVPLTTTKGSTKSLTLLWGATGEQEWTPALTTGVDWKSLTIPACLPITTDYFPDKRALNIDYVVSLYSLLPDSVNADFAQQRSATSKRPLTTLEVFRELISQRLAQGFQLILMSDNNHLEGGLSYRGTSSVAANGNSNNGLRQEDEKAYYLSIGRLFHKISLSGNTISVTRYRPRHPYPGFKYQYRYRFYAPHHGTYEESYASFTTEKLEHYNWNYLDHYVCTGGDTEFVLVDALKYWRFRIYLLPLNNAATKKIIEGAEHCDIYTKSSSADNQQMIEGFLKFIETVLNKIKRNYVVSKKPRMSLININNAPLIQPRRNSMSNFLINSQSSSAARSSERHVVVVAPSLRSGSKVMDRNSRISQSSSQESSIEGQHYSETTDETGASSTMTTSIVLLKTTATNVEIIDAMKQQQPNGLSFINQQSNLPAFTFITADAVAWLMMHVEAITTVDKAIAKMQDLHRSNLIRHASGDRNRTFLYGFYLFYIVSDEKEEINIDLQMFENEWFEAEIRPPLNWGLNRGNREQDIAHFLCDEIDVEYADSDLLLMDTATMYKRMRLETDVQSKSDRVEWGHARYQTVFRPDVAYELVVEWLTSSGSIIAELLSGWHRKASQNCGLQMIPIPHDPLALPYSNKSDPLRGPIFIPLDISCLGELDQLFKEFRGDDEATSAERLFLFQEAIVQRFGFIHCLVDNATATTNANTSSGATNNSSTSREHQYIHATGTVFILISLTATPKPRNRLNSASQRYRPIGRYSVHADVVPSPHEAYITRHVSGKNKDDYDNSRKMGFLWSWNHMISRRWRTNQGVDNNFQTKFLKDFRDFCSNTDNRLKNFWEECWEAKEVASANNSLRSNQLLLVQ